MNIPKDKIQWVKVPYLREGETREYLYSLWLNEPLASWDVFDYWERPRIDSMRQHLKKGEILFDIGAELGWCSLVYGAIVGPQNMVLIEPSEYFWPNIRALYEKNYPGIMPKGCFVGLFSDKTNELSRGLFLRSLLWPKESEGDLVDKNSYKMIHEHGDVLPQIKLDDYVEKSGIVPNALTIDVEGAESLVLWGAHETLKNNPLKVWVSEHDDLARKNYDVHFDEVASYMAGLGYSREVLSTDHERHVFYSKI